MRESEIRLVMGRNAKREALLMDQFEFIESRQRAVEQVLEGQSIWDRIAILMGLKSLKEAVDAAHLVLLREAQLRRAEMVEKAKEAERKSKLIIPSVNGVHNA